MMSGITFTLTSYEIQTNGINLHFVSPNPGAGMPTDYYVFISDEEIGVSLTSPVFTKIVQSKIDKLFSGGGISSFLDSNLNASFMSSDPTKVAPYVGIEGM